MTSAVRSVMLHFGSIVMLMLSASGCGDDDSEATADAMPSQVDAGSESDAMSNPAEALCAPPYGQGDDTCVKVAAGESIHLATLLDNRTTNQATGVLAVNPANGIDDRRGAEVARRLRPQSLGHDVEFVGPDLLDGLSNFRENCNNIDTELDTNEDQSQAIIDDGTIVAVIGLVCTNSGLQAAQPLTAGKVTVVSVNNQGPAVTAPCPGDEQTDPPSCRTSDSFYARTAPNGKFAGAKTAAYADGEGFETAVTVDDASAFSHGLSLSFADAFNGTTTNYSGAMTPDEVITAINDAGAPDFVWITTTSFTVVKTFIVKARDGIDPDLPGTTVLGLSQVGQTKDLWANPMGSLGACPDPAMGGIDTCADGVVVSVVDRAFTASNAYQQTFLPEYEELAGEPPIQNFHAFAFDAYNIVLDAIERSAVTDSSDGSLLIPRQKLRDELLFQTDVAGLTTPAGVTLDCSGTTGVGAEVGDCSAGPDYYSVDTVACPDGSGSCNFAGAPLP